MARSLLSLGIDAARAFSIAFWRARLAAGSGPPSFAATITARVSFVNSWPRFASAAPFLCLIDDHLLCPDIRLLPVEGSSRDRTLDGENPDLHRFDSRYAPPATRPAAPRRHRRSAPRVPRPRRRATRPPE